MISPALPRRRLLDQLRDLARQKLIRDAGMLTAASMFAVPVQLIQGILVARWLGPEIYGIAALIMSYPETVYSFCEVRASDALIKYLNEFDAAGASTSALGACYLGLLVDLGVAAAAFLVVGATAAWAARAIIHRPDLTRMIVIYAGACVTRGLAGTSYAVLASTGRFDLAAAIDTWSTLIRSVLVLSLIWSGLQVTGVIAGNALGIVCGSVVYGAVGVTLMRKRWGSAPLTGAWRALSGRRTEIVRFLAYSDANTLIGMACDRLDVLALGYFRGATQAGFYKLAKTVAGSSRYLSSPLQSVLYSDLARLWVRPDRTAYWNRIRRFAWQVGVPLGLILLAAIPLAFQLLLPFIGEAYRPATAALFGTMAGSAVWVFGIWLRPLYFTAGALRSWTALKLAPALLFLPVLPMVASMWGYVGAAWWYCGLNVVSATAVFLWAFRLGLRES